jgi:hypothetical protein
MPEAKPSEVTEESGEPEGEALSSDALDLDALTKRGDVDGLLTLARAYRSGAAPGGRDLKGCFEAYRAAANLGSADAEYAVALFCMSGGVVAQDLKEGATRLRAAAEKGSVPAKIYLANLYELGIHYKADAEKADVWYRNAARGARVEGDPRSEDYKRALAELGGARHVLGLIEGGLIDGDEKARLLQRARAHGYGLRLKDDATDRPTFLDALSGAEAQPSKELGAPGPVAVAPGGAPNPATDPNARAALAPGDATDAKPKPAEPALASRSSIGAGAFAYALLFVATGIGAAYAATLGARELVAHGHSLPALGARTHLVFPIVLGLVGVLPTWLVYRLGTVLKALVIGGSFAGIGWVAWGTGQAALHSHRVIQSLAFGIAGFLAGLLVLGLLGGTKRQPPRQRRHPSG